MPIVKLFNHDDFWQFSYTHYFKADVEATCLCLQTFHHGSVNLALLMLWLDEQGYLLTGEQRNQLIAGLQPTDGLLQQYRAMRRSLKPQLDQAGYQQLMDFELTVERQQQHDLVAQLNTMPLATLIEQGHPTALATNLVRYCQSLDALSLVEKLQAR
ncbi:TIGR02444 family protein [Photobacterium sanguinicancri]|uniref:TIGR02444 family protein n=1 Tax=Photobacterium sanguinicancri TaxID=875932 RepID=UPI0021C3CF6E|nr:TIGR02444 family protein [Photobacterium sanguinicancri]